MNDDGTNLVVFRRTDGYPTFGSSAAANGPGGRGRSATIEGAAAGVFPRRCPNANLRLQTGMNRDDLN
jgi:hypothetical protein